MRSIFLALLVIGCGGTDSPKDWEAASRTDEGNVCIDAPAADANGAVVVYGDFCLSSSCSQNEVGTCTATLDGTTITITSQFDWENYVGNQPCTADCGTLEADCGEIGPLPAGTYTIVHGDSTTEVDVPTESSGCDPYGR